MHLWKLSFLYVVTLVLGYTNSRPNNDLLSRIFHNGQKSPVIENRAPLNRASERDENGGGPLAQLDLDFSSDHNIQLDAPCEQCAWFDVFSCDLTCKREYLVNTRQPVKFERCLSNCAEYYIQCLQTGCDVSR